jgi:hypothetical protein
VESSRYIIGDLCSEIYKYRGIMNIPAVTIYLGSEIYATDSDVGSLSTISKELGIETSGLVAS